MKFIENYALQSGQKIGKIEILEKYFPLDSERYILVQPYSKPAKSFDYWDDVIEILTPILKEAGLSIVQVGANGEKPLIGCVHLQGKTSIAQTSYLISKSVLVLTADSFCSHLAGHYNKSRVILSSSNYSENVAPYFGSPEKQIILEPDRSKRKPSFQLDEGPKKQIDEIKIEDIASAVCKLLGLSFNFEYETLFVGDIYQSKILEVTAHGVTDVRNLGTDSIIVRLDYEFNEEILRHQMEHCPVTIVTDKPINLELLKAYKQRIKQIFYIITENNDPAFALGVTRLGLPIHMFSYLSEEKLNTYKLNFLDIAPIFRKEVKTRSQIKEIQDIPTDQLFYKSSKHLLAKGKIFPSKAAYLSDLPNSTINEICPIIDNDEFFNDSEYMVIFRKKTVLELTKP